MEHFKNLAWQECRRHTEFDAAERLALKFEAPITLFSTSYEATKL